MSLVPDAEMFCKSHLKRKVSWFIILLLDAVMSSAGVIICRDGSRGGNSCGFREPGCGSPLGHYSVSPPHLAGHGRSGCGPVEAPGEGGMLHWPHGTGTQQLSVGV